MLCAGPWVALGLLDHIHHKAWAWGLCVRPTDQRPCVLACVDQVRAVTVRHGQQHQCQLQAARPLAKHASVCVFVALRVEWCPPPVVDLERICVCMRNKG